MKHIVILCDGEFPRKAYPLYLLDSADAVVCCDGSVLKYLRYGKRRYGEERLPEAVVGDMDTLPKSWQERLADRIVHESEQDYNDQTKAMRYVLSHHPDATEIHILGATGRREDHTIGNLGLLMEYTRLFDLEGIHVESVSDWSTAFAVTDSCELHVGKGRRVSLFSADNSLTIRSEGLQWPTDAVVFDAWWPATLNRAVDDVIKLTFSHPSRALILLD
ncbi:MAG: thiamine diphosphokinase [Bacteroidales bacterium]|nr:thiamine diphosphokinase [Bacteroidales bacterium]